MKRRATWEGRIHNEVSCLVLWFCGNQRCI